MSANARRLTNVAADRVRWPRPDALGGPMPAPSKAPGATPRRLLDAAHAHPAAEMSERLGAIERDAFAKGYAQGERAGAEAGAARSQAMLRRLGQTIEELSALRSEAIRQTERQMVQLALAIAKRIVHRELSIDRALLLGMARVAAERLGAHATATIRLHPDDYAAVAAGTSATGVGAQIAVVADPVVARGGCLVQSDFGFMDVSAEAQFEELARTLLEETEPGPPTAAPAPVTKPLGVPHGE